MIRRRVLIAQAENEETHALVDVLLNSQPRLDSACGQTPRADSPPAFRPSTFAPYRGFDNDAEGDGLLHTPITPGAKAATAKPAADGPLRVVIMRGSSDHVVAEWSESNGFAPTTDIGNADRKELKRLIKLVTANGSAKPRRASRQPTGKKVGRPRREVPHEHDNSSSSDSDDAALDAPRATSPRNVPTMVKTVVAPKRAAVRLDDPELRSDDEHGENTQAVLDDDESQQQTTQDGSDDDMDLLIRSQRNARGDPRVQVHRRQSDADAQSQSMGLTRRWTPKPESYAPTRRSELGTLLDPVGNWDTLEVRTTAEVLQKENLCRLKARLRILQREPVRGNKRDIIDRILRCWEAIDGPAAAPAAATTTTTPQPAPRTSMGFVRKSIQMMTSLFGWRSPTEAPQEQTHQMTEETQDDAQDAEDDVLQAPPAPTGLIVGRLSTASNATTSSGGRPSEIPL